MAHELTSPESAAPYRLRSTLQRHRIAHKDVCARIRYSQGLRAGNALSAPSFSLLLSRQEWPVSIPQDSIKTTVEALLRERGVPEVEIAEAWVIDGDADAHATSRKPRNARLNANPEPGESAFNLPEKTMLSPAARQHFNLPRHPFIDDVQGPQDVYLSKDQRYVRESMYYAAKHAGLLAVIGESGSGKSTLRRDLLDRIRRDGEPIVIIQPKTIDKKALTAAHICDAIIADLSNETPKLSLEAKGRQIERILASSSRTGALHALVIEEAHDLSVATLKYLKRFWEMEDGFRKLLGIVLIGQPELRDMLDERRNYEAREVIRRMEIATLKSLNGNLEEYLTLKFKRVGLNLADVFEADAFDAIRARLTQRANNGTVQSHLYPLVVQNLVSKAMNEAADLSLPKVSAQLIGRL